MRSLLLAALGIVVMGLPLPGAAATTDPKVKTQSYKWVDADGTVHYGDRVPVEATGRERAVLNRQGVEVRELEAQKTPAQIEEQGRIEAAALHQKQHDQFLLATYASTKDIEQLRDIRLGQVEGQIKAGWIYVETLEGRLRALQTRAFLFKPYSERADAKRLPDDLAEDLVHTMNEAVTQRRSLDTRRVEADQIRDQFEQDIARYSAIKLARASP